MEKFLKIVGIAVLAFVMVILLPILLTVAIFFTYIPELLIAGMYVFGVFIGLILVLVWFAKK